MTTGSNNSNSRSETLNNPDGTTVSPEKRPHNFIPEEDLIAELQRLNETNGRPPSQNEMKRDGKYSLSPYLNRFGSWSNALNRIGLEPQTPGLGKQISKKDIIQDIQKVAAEFGRAPTSTEMAQHGIHSLKTAQARFGSWNEALRAACFEPHNEIDISDERLIREIQRLAEELGHPPSTNDLKRDGELSYVPYFRRFDDWASAVRAAGYEPNGWASGPDNPKWTGGIASSLYYGSNWQTQRTQALQRDSFICQMPGCDLTRESHCEQFGCDLHVHHIIPVATFCEADNPDYGEMNCIDNLVTLCLPHHRYWKQMSPLKPDIRE